MSRRPSVLDLANLAVAVSALSRGSLSRAASQLDLSRPGSVSASRAASRLDLSRPGSIIEPDASELEGRSDTVAAAAEASGTLSVALKDLEGLLLCSGTKSMDEIKAAMQRLEDACMEVFVQQTEAADPERIRSDPADPVGSQVDADLIAAATAGVLVDATEGEGAGDVAEDSNAGGEAAFADDGEEGPVACAEAVPEVSFVAPEDAPLQQPSSAATPAQTEGAPEDRPEDAPLATALHGSSIPFDIAFAASELLQLLATPGGASRAAFQAVVSRMDAAGFKPDGSPGPIAAAGKSLHRVNLAGLLISLSCFCTANPHPRGSHPAPRSH